MTAQRFLVPTDFTPYADQALTEAIDLAHAVGAHLTLLHVMQLMPLTVGEVPPEYFLHVARRDPAFHLGGIHASVFEDPFGGRRPEVTCGLSFFDEVALADARSLENPLVGGIHDLFQVFISDSSLGKIMAYSSYFCATCTCIQRAEI